jgi:hypothetical protein
MNTKNILSISVILAMLVSSITIGNAVAQSSDDTNQDDKNEKQQMIEDKKTEKQQRIEDKKETAKQARENSDGEKAFALGLAVKDGVATKSYLRLWLMPDTTTGDSTYSIKKGTILVADSSRNMYKLIPDSWNDQKIDITKDFQVEGKVQDKKGTVTTMTLTGEKIVDLKNGSLYSVTGNIETDSSEIGLYYLSPQMKK